MWLTILIHLLWILYINYIGYKTVKNNTFPTYLPKPLYWILWLLVFAILCWSLILDIKLMITS